MDGHDRDVEPLAALGIALAGGSIGSLVTLAAGVPEQVRHDDRGVRALDHDLGQWIADEMVRLEREAVALRNRVAADGQLYAGTYLVQLAHLKEGALHAYRDQARSAQRGRSAIRDSEGWRHAIWRGLRRRPLPKLRTPADSKELLDLWRGEVRRGEDRAPVSDPTKRSLEWAIAKYATTENRTGGWPAP